jgi:glutamate-ammonia-ligase adenylyltransferase
VDADDLAALARFAGYPSLKAFEAAFTRHARRVEAHYALLFEEGPSLAAEAGALSFTGAEADSETLATLSRLGFRDAKTAAETVRGWHFGRRPAVTSARAREALTELTPALLVAFGRSGDPDAGLNALDQAFARMPAAVELMTILRRHEALLALFATILGSAPRLARLVAAHPHVLDALIDPTYGPAAFEGDAAARRIAAVVGEPSAFEEALDRLRDAVRPETFVVGARLLSGAFSPERAGAALAAVADAAVGVALGAARREIEGVHGAIPQARVAVIGLGRLGARDLTASSDLDLLILYDAPDLEARSDGPRPLDGVTWHQRLAQRLITALSAATRRGVLYDVDLRLRPAGSKGPLAVRLASFEAYQRAEAELWEHMALTKARFVCGDEGLGQAALAIAAAVIARPREPQAVLKGVAEMRAMIATAKGDADPWDLKLAAGGLTDLDFIAEALILIHAHAHPGWALAPTAAVFRLAAEAGVLAPGDAAILVQALALFDAVTHMQRLTIEGAFEPGHAVPAPVMRLVAKAGGAPDASTLAAALADQRKAVRAIFRRLIG